MEALEAVAAHDESGWNDVDEDEDIFGEGSEDDDDDHDSTTEPLTSSEIEGSDDGHSEGHDEESSADDSDDDGHSGDGSQGTYGRVSHIFVDASFNQLGTSVQRALHGKSLVQLLCVHLIPDLLLQRRQCSVAASELSILQASLAPLLLHLHTQSPQLLLLLMLFEVAWHGLESQGRVVTQTK